MYSGLKYLFQRVIDCLRNNNELSGGLPHSEIRGSKPILGSPRLIAEYHVLHRLLLPRHPPNALLALDLIQKKTGLHPSRPDWRAGSSAEASVPVSEVVHSRPGSLQDLVSVLDLDNIASFPDHSGGCLLLQTTKAS